MSKLEEDIIKYRGDSTITPEIMDAPTLGESGLTGNIQDISAISLPKQEMMLLLARKLDCSVMDFFADEEDLARAEKTAGLVLSEDEWDIIRVFRELSNKEKHIVMAQVYKTEERLHSKEL